MPTYKDYGIVLNSYKLGEADKILNIYTKDNGLVRAVGKGIRRSTSKFTGKLDQLSCCFFQFAKGQNLDVISDLEQVNSFPKLRKDLKRLTYAILYLEVVASFAHEKESESNQVYELIYKSLDELQFVIDIELFSINFILNFLKIHGFKPQLSSCVSCSNEVFKIGELEDKESRGIPFSTILGGVLCNKCSKVIQHRLISASIINIFQFSARSSQLAALKFNDFQNTLNLLHEYIDFRAKNKIRTFDLVLSL